MSNKTFFSVEDDDFFGDEDLELPQPTKPSTQPLRPSQNKIPQSNVELRGGIAQLRPSLSRLAAFEYNPPSKKSKPASPTETEFPKSKSSLSNDEPARSCSLQKSQTGSVVSEKKKIAVRRPARKRSPLLRRSHNKDDLDPDFAGNPWLLMNEQLGISGKTHSPLSSFTVANTLKQASLGRLADGKVAHLRVLVKSISQTGNSTSALLKDPTGEMSGSIHRKLFEQHGSALSAGSVLILKRATVFSPTGRRYYLNVTPANVVRLYPAKTAQATLASIDKALLEGILDSLGENPQAEDSITSLLDGLNDDDFN